MVREVVFTPEARDDLLNLYDYIADQTAAARAQVYTNRIVSYCLGFTVFPERGRRRDDLRPGLRIIGFGRRVTIAFHVIGNRITIDGVLYGGRDLNSRIPRSRLAASTRHRRRSIFGIADARPRLLPGRPFERRGRRRQHGLPASTWDERDAGLFGRHVSRPAPPH